MISSPNSNMLGNDERVEIEERITELESKIQSTIHGEHGINVGISIQVLGELQRGSRKPPCAAACPGQSGSEDGPDPGCDKSDRQAKKILHGRHRVGQRHRLCYMCHHFLSNLVYAHVDNAYVGTRTRPLVLYIFIGQFILHEKNSIRMTIKQLANRIVFITPNMIKGIRASETNGQYVLPGAFFEDLDASYQASFPEYHNEVAIQNLKQYDDVQVTKLNMTELVAAIATTRSELKLFLSSLDDQQKRNLIRFETHWDYMMKHSTQDGYVDAAADDHS